MTKQSHIFKVVNGFVKLIVPQEHADEDKARSLLEPERRLVQGCFEGFA